MSNQIETQTVLPSEAMFQLPASLNGCRKYELRVSPYGQNTFTQNQSCKLTLPMIQRTLFQNQTGYIHFVLNFTATGTVTQATPTVGASFLLGTFASCIQRMTFRSGSGYVLETIENYGEIINALTSMTLDHASKAGMENLMGFSSSNLNSNVCQIINKYTADSDIGGSAGKGLNYSCAIPLLGIWNSTKFWPAWNNDGLEIEFVFADVNKFTTPNTDDANPTFGVTSYTVTNVEFVCECLELSPELYNTVKQMNPDRILIKTQTYAYSSGSLSAGQGAGTIDVPFNIKCNSLKQVIWYSQPVNAAEKTYSAVNPNLQSYNFIVNGVSYPMTPVKCEYPGECHAQNSKSWSGLYSADNSGSIGRESFNTSSTQYNPFHRSYNTARTALTSRASKWYQCVDFETINAHKDLLYSGINTNSTTAQVRLQIKTALSNSVHNVHYFAVQDCVLVMDQTTGITSVIV